MLILVPGQARDLLVFTVASMTQISFCPRWPLFDGEVHPSFQHDDVVSEVISAVPAVLHKPDQYRVHVTNGWETSSSLPANF